MASYLETQTRIADELSRADLGSQIKLAILSAIKYYGVRRWPWNEYSDTLVTVASQTYVNLPADFVEMDILQITIGNTDRPLSQRPIADIILMRENASVGQPTDYSIYQNRIELYRTPSAIYNLPIHYIKTLTVLSADGDTNAWLTDAEELIRLHAKKDLYANKIRNTKAAQDMQALEDSELLRLESYSERRITTGRMRAYYL